MKVLLYLVAAATISAYALPKPEVILEREKGITVNSDGSKNIGGESGITTNAAGETTNVGGPAGITIGESAATSNSTKGTGTTGAKKGKSTTSAGSTKGSGDVASLATFIGALQRTNQGGNTATSGNGTASAAGVITTLEGAR